MFNGYKSRLTVAVMFLALQLAFVPGGLLFAQAISGSISGIISDQMGAVIPGVSVSVKNVNTGVAHSTVTDDLGSYRVSGLVPGRYEVKAELAGFKTEVITGIELTVNQQAVVNLSLKVGEVTEQVIVTGYAPVVESTTSMLSGLVDEKKIRDLPLNGRDFSQLALLQTGAVATFTAGPDPFVAAGSAGGGRTGKFVVNGVRPTGNNFLLDGTEINDPSFNIPPGGAAGVALGVEAIREFRILTNTYSAEYGRNAGALINSVTKSGTNEIHGSAFEFLRNNVLDAKNFFDKPNAPIPQFKRNQFGFTVGGPIRKNKTFFFGSYEGLRERLGVTSVATVPDENARRGLLPDPRNPGRFIDVGIAPGVKQFLDLYPLPNGRNFGDGTAEFLGSQSQPTDEDYFVVKIDHNFSENDLFFARYTFDDSSALLPFASTPVPGFPTDLDRRNQYATVQYQKIINPNLLNEFRFGYSRIKQTLFPTGVAPTSISLFPGPRPLGTIAPTNVSPIGNSSILPIGSTSNLFQFIDNFSYNKGRHSVKFGFDIRRIQISNFFDATFDGNYFIGPLRNMLEGKSLFYLGATPDSTSRRDWRQSQFAFFGQDDFKLTKDFTLNFGLRYEFITVPTEKAGRLTNLRNPETDKDVTLGAPLFENPSLRNFAPRLGFAYDISGNGKTVVRSGFGVFYDHIWENIFGNTRFQPPFLKALFVPGAPFPDPLRARGVPIALSIQAIDFKIKNPYVMQYNLNVQHEITRDTVLKAGYVGTRGVKLVRVFEANTARPQILQDGTKFFPPNSVRRNPAFGPVRQRTADANSWYNSLQIEVNRRFSGGLQFQASYTLSKLIDDAAGPFQTDTIAQPTNTMDPEDRGRDKALSPFDARHNFVYNFTYDLPIGQGRKFGADLTGLAGKLLDGWQINGILTLVSGRPFTPVVAFNRSNNLQSGTGVADRPNLKPGASPKDALLKDPARWFDPNIFELQPAGFLGNAGRNILLGPDFKNFDFSLIKNTPINEQVTLQFRAEFFNLTNHPNFQIPSNVGTVAGTVAGGDIIFNDPSGVPVGNAGRIFKTVNTSRQIQFALKLIF